MKYLSIVVAAALVLLAAPLKAQSGSGSGAPDQVSATWHRGGGGQGSNHGNNGWQGRGNGGQEGGHGWQGRGNGGQEGGHGWQGRGNGGQEGNRGNGSYGDRGRGGNGGNERGWNGNDGQGRGQDGHWVWVETRRPVLRFHWAFGHMGWFWEWVTDSHREWHH